MSQSEAYVHIAVNYPDHNTIVTSSLAQETINCLLLKNYQIVWQVQAVTFKLEKNIKL